MNKEVHYEGWLIKSPPTKRIWRARWRRRWFTLKQGEIPEQFCLEYYTDRNCRKLKGVIDLDQCEQVDCGLRLENRKQKFQFMFDIKTPKRTYYLAADTEADMRDWVNCICQVCHLHDTKQSNDMQAADSENRSQTTTGSSASNNTTTTTINSSAGGIAGNHSNNGALSGTAFRQSFSSSSNASDILRRSNAPQSVIEQQPLPQHSTANNSDCAYVNTDYNNRETMLCDARLVQQLQSTTYKPASCAATQAQPPASPGAALYLNSSMFQQQQQDNGHNATRLAINANGVVRKIPENLVLNTTPLADAQQAQHSVQPSPALSTASGPYIPISECFSGSPKFILDGNNPTTPLNNLDPKFYDTPRSHNNIGLNLTNDQSYSPKITNCSLQQLSSATKDRHAHRSDSDSESVFTDDDEWAHPLPLRENVDRTTRPSDSSVENESFVVTYSQRFSKLPDDVGGNGAAAIGDSKNQPTTATTLNSSAAAAKMSTASATDSSTTAGAQDRQSKVLKNKNILSLDFKEHEKLHRDLPQLSDTENTSPAIGPRDATSVVEESYDIPRSHNLPYYNMCQLYDKMSSPDVNPIAASTPNLIAGTNPHELQQQHSTDSVKTLPRPHCYTNAAPSKVEGNVFRYDFIEQGDLPPVNRKLKPKVSVEDKPPEESPARPPCAGSTFPAATFQQQQQQQQQHAAEQAQHIDPLTSKIKSMNLQPQNATAPASENSAAPLQPPTVDRKLKPYPYKFATTAPASRRSTGAPLSMCIPNDGENTSFVMETRTLPRQPRPNYATSPSHIMHNQSSATNAGTASGNSNNMLTSSVSSNNIQHQHQRTVSATAALPATSQSMQLLQMQAAKTNEHKLQYFELDIANAPAINRQSLTANNAGATGSAASANNQYAGNRFALPTDPTIRAPNKSTVVYNSVDFVKTEAFKRVREESKKKRECGNTNAINNNNNNNNNTTNTHNNNK